MILLCMYIPVLVVYVVKERIFSERKTYLRYGIEYLCYFLASNAFCLFVLSYLLNKNGSVTEKIILYNDYALKYIILVASGAVGIAVVDYFLRHNSIILNIKVIEFIRENRVVYKILMYIYFLFLFLLVLIRAFDNNFWGDEGVSIRFAKQTFSMLIASTAGDVHPPLYYIILRVFYLLGGDLGYVYL